MTIFGPLTLLTSNAGKNNYWMIAFAKYSEM